MTTGFPSAIQRSIPSTIAGGTLPRPIAAMTIAASRRARRVEQSRIRAGERVDDVDRRRRATSGASTVVGAGSARRKITLAVVDHAERTETRAVERVEHVRVRLGDVERREHAIGHHDHHAAPRASALAATRTAPPRLPGPSHPRSLDVRIAPVKTTGFSLFDRARHEIRGLLERVGAVRDDDAVDLRPREVLDDPLAQRPHALDRHVRTGKRAPIIDL